MLFSYLKELLRPKKLLTVLRHFRVYKANKHKNLILGLNTIVRNVKFEENIFIGRNCSIENSSIGRNSYVNSNTSIRNCNIGRYSSIGSKVTIGIGQHPTNFISTHPAFYANNKSFQTYADELYFEEYFHCEIGNDVWVGSNSTILNNIKIGDGAIIAYGSVVTKDVEPYSIVGGIPAKKIRYRFDEETIEELIQKKWWEWDEKYLKANFKSFHSATAFLSLDNQFSESNTL